MGYSFNRPFEEIKREVQLLSREGKSIPLIIEKTDEGTTLIQCYEPQEMMNYFDVGDEVRLSSDCYIKGAVVPGEGAFFDLFDSFGTLINDVISLNDQEADELLFSRIC